MPELEVELTNYGRAFIRVRGSKQTYTYDRAEGFKDGTGAHIGMWMQGAQRIDILRWSEEFPFPKLAEKIEHVANLSAFKSDVIAAIDAVLSLSVRARAIGRAATRLEDPSYRDDIDTVDWSAERFPAAVTWDLIPKGAPISAVFEKIKTLVKPA